MDPPPFKIEYPSKNDTQLSDNLVIVISVVSSSTAIILVVLIVFAPFIYNTILHKFEAIRDYRKIRKLK